MDGDVDGGDGAVVDGGFGAVILGGREAELSVGYRCEEELSFFYCMEGKRLGKGRSEELARVALRWRGMDKNGGGREIGAEWVPHGDWIVSCG